MSPASEKPWASLRTTWHKCPKTGTKENPTTRSENRICDALLPTLRLAPTACAQFACWEATRTTLRLDMGSLSWGSKYCTCKTRITGIYSAPKTKLVCTKTASCSLTAHCANSGVSPSGVALPLGCKTGAKLTLEEEQILNKKPSNKIQKQYDEKECQNQPSSRGAVPAGQLLTCMTPRPSQRGHAHDHMLEGKELPF